MRLQLTWVGVKVEVGRKMVERETRAGGSEGKWTGELVWAENRKTELRSLCQKLINWYLKKIVYDIPIGFRKYTIRSVTLDKLCGEYLHDDVTLNVTSSCKYPPLCAFLQYYRSVTLSDSVTSTITLHVSFFSNEKSIVTRSPRLSFLSHFFY